MSGPDNLRGIDYQISYTVYRLLYELLKDKRNVYSYEIESLDDDSEDLNINFVGGEIERVQIKKKQEGYLWNPSEIREILKRFDLRDEEGVRYLFITDGSASRDLKKLIRFLRDDEKLDDKTILKFCDDDLSPEKFKNIVEKTSIVTRFLVSDDGDNPAKLIKSEIRKILNSPEVILNESIDEVFLGIWSYIFDLSSRGEEVLFDDVEVELQKIGVIFRSPAWRRFPVPERFIGRESELRDLRKLVDENFVTVVYGVSGTGKTSLISRLSVERYEGGFPICWIGITPLTSIIDIVNNIGLCLSYYSFDDWANFIVQDCKSEDIYVDRIIQLLISVDVTIVFDSVNSGIDGVKYVVKRVLSEIPHEGVVGKIIISSTDVSAYSVIVNAIQVDGVASYLMPSLNYDDFKLVLGDRSSGLSDQEVNELRLAVGGHYLSTMLLRRVIAVSKEIDFDHIKNIGSLEAQNELTDKVIKGLDLDDRAVFLSCSVFDYEFEINLAEKLNDGLRSVAASLRNLSNFGLVRFNSKVCMLHESVRPVAYSMLSDKRKIECNEIVQECLRRELESKERSGGGYPFDLIMRWGNHVEKLAALGRFHGQSQLISNLEENQLDIIWSVHRFGYPFDYREEDDDNADIKNKDIFIDLLRCGLIEEREGRFFLNGLDILDILYVIYLCKSRKISDSVGYILDFRPNMAFEEQGLLCPWEHCIEHMPFPPQSRQSYVSHKEYLRKMFEQGAYDEKTPEQRQFLAMAMEAPIPDDATEEEVDPLEYGGCPFFGHCCPGGPSQARACASAEEACNGID